MRVHPRVATAFAEQLVSRRAAVDRGARTIGWKIGLDFPEVQAVIGDEPILGHLTSETRLAPGATYNAAPDAALRAETELAVVLGPDRAVDRSAVALEIVDVTRPPDDLEGIVAANAFHLAFVLGEVGPLVPSGAAAWVEIDGRRVERGAVGDYARLLESAETLLAEVGEGLRAGDVLLCGAITHVPVRPGSHVTAGIDQLGTVELSVA